MKRNASRFHRPWQPSLLAIVLFLLSGLLPNGFGSNLDIAVAQATNILRLAVFLGVIAAGQTLVIISGSEGIDLSAGAVVTLRRSSPIRSSTAATKCAPGAARGAAGGRGRSA